MFQCAKPPLTEAALREMEARPEGVDNAFAPTPNNHWRIFVFWAWRIQLSTLTKLCMSEVFLCGFPLHHMYHDLRKSADESGLGSSVELERSCLSSLRGIIGFLGINISCIHWERRETCQHIHPMCTPLQIIIILVFEETTASEHLWVWGS